MTGGAATTTCGTAGPSPPRPPFVLTIGVTGHRRNRLSADQAAGVAERLPAVLASIVNAAARVHDKGRRWFAEGAADIGLATALAEGADRLAADAAEAAAIPIDAILPFAAADYAADFDADGCAHFRRQLAAARRCLELPGDRANPTAAYAMVGGAILAVADLVVAVWDGGEGAGPGGTADVVATALQQGLPVVHVPVDAAQPVRLLWPGDGPAGSGWAAAVEPPARPFDDPDLETVLGARLLPPDDPAETAALSTFLAAKPQTRIRRLEYPLLLALLGADRWRRVRSRRDPPGPGVRPWWQPFDTAMAGWVAADARQRLEAGYAWADDIAICFAQRFRSGHVINFIFSALAVGLALLGLFFGTLTKAGLVAVELLLIGAIVVNTRRGQQELWQQRWLDSRQLAERLRPMRSLKLLAIARPPRTSAASRTGNDRWIDWYASALWRQLGLPAGRIDPGRVTALAQLIRTAEVQPEIDYHQTNERRMLHVHHRLHRFGSICFLLTALLCAGFLAATALLGTGATKEVAVLFSVATAALPAFGSAAYGLRIQGDFEGSAARSAATAEALRALLPEFAGCRSLPRAAALASAAATVMLVDLAEWRLTYQQRQLQIPG